MQLGNSHRYLCKLSISLSILKKRNLWTGKIFFQQETMNVLESSVSHESVSHGCNVLGNRIDAAKKMITAICIIVKFTSHWNIGNESVDGQIGKGKNE